jgi:7,8-dihydropterin-6-yl-methyl-4-(beta-D-ribofuranosyl)aminobenzene 5'-phosphate synthase
MSKKIFIGILCLVLGLVLILVLANKEKSVQDKVIKPMTEKQESSESKTGITLTTLFDNYQYDSRLETGWGFSCLVDIEGKKILFDTGTNSATLLANMAKLDIEAQEIDIVVLSHIHDDHVGGLSGVLEKNHKVTVYIPSSFPDSMRRQIQNSGANYVDVAVSTKISDGVYSTGELGTTIKEQSLLIDSAEGLIVITGCAHPGIVEIVKETKKIFPEKDICLVMGGFHLLNASDRELQATVDDFKKLGVKRVAPSHCSGDKTRELFQEVYQEEFIENGVGKIITI